MPGAFDASPEFDYDAFRTAEELQRSGEDVLRWLAAVATSQDPAAVNVQVVNEIHRRWFETTFPADAGHHRTEMVLNRKGTAVAVEAILPAVDQACGNWAWRRENVTPENDAELIEFIVAEAHTLTTAVYDAHLFVDGNTRTTWHLRNYLLMLDGLRPLTDVDDQDAYEEAWWRASTQDHAQLDAVVLRELDTHDR